MDSESARSYIATSRDVHRAAQSVRNLAKNLGHLRGALEIKLVGREFHAVRVAHGLSGLDAEQDFLGVRVLVMEVVAIVCRDQRNAGFLREANQIRVHAMLDVESLVLNFEK